MATMVIREDGSDAGASSSSSSSLGGIGGSGSIGGGAHEPTEFGGLVPRGVVVDLSDLGSWRVRGFGFEGRVCCNASIGGGVNTSALQRVFDQKQSL
jgi:hypothetical protein